MRYITMTEHVLAFGYPIIVAAIHTAEHGCPMFANLADEGEAAAVMLALQSVVPNLSVVVL